MRFLQLISIAPKTPQWCSFLSFILSIGGTIDWQNTSVNRRQLIFDELAFAVVFRVALVALTLSHEYSHALAAACLGYHTSLTETANWRGNVSVRAWTLSLCPFYTWPKEASNPCFLVPSMASSAHATIVRLFGAFFSFFVSIVFMELSSQNDLSDAWTTGAGIVAAGAFVSDVLQLEGSSDNVFGCGNFGMMVINTAEKAGVDIAKTLRRMAGATAARGGQSGGIVTLLQDGSAHRCRFVPSKREDLARSLVLHFWFGLSVQTILAWVRRILCCCFSRSKGRKEEEKNSREDCVFFAGVIQSFAVSIRVCDGMSGSDIVYARTRTHALCNLQCADHDREPPAPLWITSKPSPFSPSAQSSALT